MLPADSHPGRQEHGCRHSSPTRPAPSPVAVIADGRITAGLLHDLLYAEDLPPQLLGAGILACALAAVDGLTVVVIASIADLS